MKRILTGFTVALLLFSASSLFAQSPGGRRMDPAEMKQKLIDSVGVSGTQADSVIAIGQEFRGKMRDIFMDQSLSQDDKRAKMSEINSQRDTRIQAVLGDDLFKKYQDYEARNRQQRGGGRGRWNGGGGGGNQ